MELYWGIIVSNAVDATLQRMEPSLLFMKYDGNLGGTTGINALVPVLGMSAFFIYSISYNNWQ
ncbi:hypothetical protein CN326_17405 [Bacillus sp. AFS018417]|nr:hypothetical protein CN326_17405 [Bacillus sp. AFS018417]